jgi:hypothetical protein
LLGWIACSKRPLKWHEIQGAVSVNVQDQSVDFENRQLCTHVRDICGSLIDVLPGDRVQLVHGTAKSQVILSAWAPVELRFETCFPHTDFLNSYLTHNDYVKIHSEEYKLALLCLQYACPFNCLVGGYIAFHCPTSRGTIKIFPMRIFLDFRCSQISKRLLILLFFRYLLFDCFGPSLSDEVITDYTMKGYYAFQDVGNRRKIYAFLHCSVILFPETMSQISLNNLHEAAAHYFAT